MPGGGEWPWVSAHSEAYVDNLMWLKDSHFRTARLHPPGSGVQMSRRRESDSIQVQLWRDWVPAGHTPALLTGTPWWSVSVNSRHHSLEKHRENTLQPSEWVRQIHVFRNGTVDVCYFLNQNLIWGPDPMAPTFIRETFENTQISPLICSNIRWKNASESPGP